MQSKQSKIHKHKWMVANHNPIEEQCTYCWTTRIRCFRKDGSKDYRYKRSKEFLEELKKESFDKYTTETRTCSKCKKEKPFNEFRKNKNEVRGVTHRCKECLSEDYYSNRDFHVARHKKYRKDNPEKVLAYIVTVPQKQKKAGQMIQSRLLYNTIDRPGICSDCGNECKPDAHHADYDKPLDVTWLCRPCHMKLHRDQRTYG